MHSQYALGYRFILFLNILSAAFLCNYKYILTHYLYLLQEVLVIAEFATPLMSIYEKMLDQLANFSELERLHQKMKFEEKVQEILEMDDECQGAFCFLQLEGTIRYYECFQIKLIYR